MSVSFPPHRTDDLNDPDHPLTTPVLAQAAHLVLADANEEALNASSVLRAASRSHYGGFSNSSISSGSGRGRRWAPGSLPALSSSLPRQSTRNMASPAGGGGAAAGMLMRQLKIMRTDTDMPGISCGLVGDNVFEWEVTLMIDEDCRFYGGGIFHAKLSFPQDYPHMPPKMKFEPALFHPNIFESGDVCISILHPPEEDKYGYESAAERWTPVQTPASILLSVLSMLGAPNDESPANLEAAKLWREDQKEFRRRCRKCVRDSLEGGDG